MIRHIKRKVHIVSKQPEQELIQELTENDVESELPDAILDGIAGGYNPDAYNPEAVAEEMKHVIAEAKKSGKNKDYIMEIYIHSSNAIYGQYGAHSPEYQLEMDKFRYVAENWDN